MAVCCDYNVAKAFIDVFAAHSYKQTTQYKIWTPYIIERDNMDEYRLERDYFFSVTAAEAECKKRNASKGTIIYD